MPQRPQLNTNLWRDIAEKEKSSTVMTIGEKLSKAGTWMMKMSSDQRLI